MNNAIIELKNVKKSFGNKQVLKSVDLKIYGGDFISIIGNSGSGKSTLMNILGLIDVFEGEYLIEGHSIKKRKLESIRNENIGFVFQLYNLIPNITVYDNIILPYLYSKYFINDINERIKRISKDLKIEDLLYKKINNLSGGEKQRVAIARAIMMQPQIILADEPTGALDTNNTDIVIDFLRQYSKLGNSVILVTHNLEVAKKSNRILKLENGKLYEV